MRLHNHWSGAEAEHGIDSERENMLVTTGRPVVWLARWNCSVVIGKDGVGNEQSWK